MHFQMTKKGGKDANPPYRDFCLLLFQAYFPGPSKRLNRQRKEKSGQFPVKAKELKLKEVIYTAERIDDCPPPTVVPLLRFTDEITQTPSLPMFSAENFSNDDTAMQFLYWFRVKHCEILVGSTPGGLVNFVSNAYGGCTSDRQIVERCEIVQLCDPGDSVMADKGFNVQDLFARMDVAVNIPIFLKKRNRISGKTLLRDRKVSSKRVNIERMIGLGKTFKILTNPLNGTETKLAYGITFSCFMSCNFRTCIVPKDA
ncbi:unnamed protein product [Mytilus coruscus]|uniref:DDE Tnp4 domain-containing protein n=1 Tax=Mytilus coruscus TaxID=42192 RepID=A0A6J8A9D5_MYTCO|nr:unnamed protein product [Mytilus coruscus]